MKKLVLLLLLFTAAHGFAQTKKIAHRSHSGNNASFDINGEDDFGLPPGYKKETKDTTVKKQTPAAKDSIPAKKTQPAKMIKSSAAPTRKTKVTT